MTCSVTLQPSCWAQHRTPGTLEHEFSSYITCVLPVSASPGQSPACQPFLQQKEELSCTGGTCSKPQLPDSWWNGLLCNPLYFKASVFYLPSTLFKVSMELFTWVGSWRRLTSDAALAPWVFPALTKVSGELGLRAATWGSGMESTHPTAFSCDEKVLHPESESAMLILTNASGLLYTYIEENHLLIKDFILFSSIEYLSVSLAKFPIFPLAFPANTYGDLKVKLCLL